jgi:hypothetical protein
MREKIKGHKVGISDQSFVYPYENYAYVWLEAWNFPDYKGNPHFDFGIDHFILTDNGDFDCIDVRIAGEKLEDL